MKQIYHKYSVWRLIGVASLLLIVTKSAMPDEGPSMQTLYENGLILYREKVLEESERLSRCKTDDDCHPLSNFCCRFQNTEIGYDRSFCLAPKDNKFSGVYLDIESDPSIEYTWECETSTSYDESQYNFIEFRNKQMLLHTTKQIAKVSDKKAEVEFDNDVKITDTFVANPFIKLPVPRLDQLIIELEKQDQEDEEEDPKPDPEPEPKPDPEPEPDNNEDDNNDEPLKP